MKNFYPLYKKEISSYFVSPIAYAMVTVFLALSGYFFYTLTGYYSFISMQWQSRPYYELNLMDAVFRPLFANFAVTMLLVLPMLTMRSFSEEKKSGTIELLFTFPLKDEEIILAKFLSALSIFKGMLIITLLYPIILAFFVKIHWGTVFTGYLGLILMGASFISLGMFVSSMTENQVIAGVVSFGMSLLFWIVGWSAEFAGWKFGEVLNNLSIIQHFESFSRGVIDTQDIIFYLCFSFFFLFLTFNVLGSKKWRG